MNEYLTARFQPLVAPLAQRWRGSLLQLGWQLWLNELRACLPSWLCRPAIPQQVYTWPLRTPLPESPVQATPVLLLPPSAVLVQRLQLPVAAARNLHAVVGYELDRLTPFDASQLYFVARQEGRSGAWLQVMLVAILRERLDSLLADCAAQGLQPQRVDVGDSADSRLGINLLPAALRPSSPRNTQRLRQGLLWLCGALLFAAMLLWLNSRQVLVAQMQTTVQAQKAKVAQLQQVRQQLANTRGAADYLTRRKAAQPTLAALLNELTTCLPADTWVEQLEITRDAELSFSGQSAKASGLITQIKGCRSLENARFEGVIQPDAQTAKDHFSLRADIHQEAADGPSTD